ncbi:15-hydroxyprostaglandin dehydrogenase [NAD(+)]-like isoform X1 [Haliotis rubra]|uniref:15-hydroxyprostaglandin dehydrogenase [NAD(+)]-like isoform X1 n=2 Tax=Haliotis rubra TaxID=36100 RepID=UPI001EE56197|nr:15-hydroxyprostaglandin dehydrogenase [NAD(+)]-like isoform X1 [Haliotis rubra]
MSFSGKVALITGAAQGFGKAFSEVLLKRGANVCVADIKVQTGEATVSSFQQQYSKDRAFFAKCDVTQENDIKATFDAVKKQYGRLDLVINNAGIADEGAWNKMIDINLKGVVMGSQYAVEALRRDKGGNGGLVINVSSAAGLTPVYITPVYAASKFGVVGFTRSWADNPRLESMGVSFCCFCPTFADTEIMKGVDDGKKSLYADDARELVKMLGVMSVKEVVDAFEQLLDLPDKNGVIVTVTKRNGINIKTPNMTNKL